MKRCNKCKGKGFRKGDIGYVLCECSQQPQSLTFKRFHETNVARAKADIKHSHKWIPLAWGGALAGEVGELCNYLKKMARVDDIKKKKLAHEVADILTYLSLLANELDIDMEAALIEKFNIVSKRWNSKYKL